MNRISKIFVFACLCYQLLGLVSCGTKESIEPAYEAVSIDSQLESRPIEVSLNIDDLEIEEIELVVKAIEEIMPQK